MHCTRAVVIITSLCSGAAPIYSSGSLSAAALRLRSSEDAAAVRLTVKALRADVHSSDIIESESRQSRARDVSICTQVIEIGIERAREGAMKHVILLIPPLTRNPRSITHNCLQ